MERNILSVFVASPSDLGAERKAIREVVERINKIYGRRIGWQIELLGWEDTLPGFSRPQALINKDVETCDLFIGMLWKRWGSDSGEFSSGFEEEFTIARNRRINGDRPEIWMLFKHIDEDLYKDPGEQLKRTLIFRKELIESKELLFKEFEDLDALKEQIYDDLNAYILDINNLAQSFIITAETESQRINNTSIEYSEKPNLCDEKNSQLIEVFSKMSRCLGEGSEAELDLWERVRVYLSSSALFSQSHIGELFSTHEANLVYFKRKAWELTSYEKWFLVRSFIGDLANVIPGWYWLSDKNIIDIDDIIYSLSGHDRNNSVRKGALQILSKTNATLPSDFISKLLLDKDKNIVIQAIKLTKYCEGKKALELIEPLLNSTEDDIRNTALHEYIDILYLFDPIKSFRLLTDKSNIVTSEYKLSLQKLDLKISNDLLVESVFEAAPRIREFSAEYLSRTGALSKEISEKLLKDPDSYIRKIGFEWLLRNGVEFTLSDISKLFPRPKERPTLLGLSKPEVTEDDIIPLVFARKSKEELEELIDYYSGHGNVAYEALAVSYTSDVAQRLRSDLNENFSGLKTKSIDKLYSEYGDKASTLVSQYKPDVEQFIIDNFTSAAMKGLAKLCDTEDIVFARNYLGNLKYGMADEACIAIIEKYGDDGDLELLISKAEKLYGTKLERAIIAAINICSDKQLLIEQLIESQEKNIAVIAAKQIEYLNRDIRIDLAKKLLSVENEKLRLIGFVIITKHVGRDEVEHILDEYINRSTYYYNVVTYLDGYLYAPDKYKENYLSIIDE